MFSLAGKLGLLVCHRCSKKIETVKEFSIDHKEPWQNSTTPNKLFFDNDNIAFSHLFCNIGAAEKPNKIYADAKERGRVQSRRFYAANSERFLAKKRQKYRESTSVIK